MIYSVDISVCVYENEFGMKYTILMWLDWIGLTIRWQKEKTDWNFIPRCVNVMFIIMTHTWLWQEIKACLSFKA